jgi:hypothetical protein
VIANANLAPQIDLSTGGNRQLLQSIAGVKAVIVGIVQVAEVVCIEDALVGLIRLGCSRVTPFLGVLIGIGNRE